MRIGNGCSTPEGIGAKIGSGGKPMRSTRATVLNARGHRSGDRVAPRPPPASSRLRAQRPRASERRSAAPPSNTDVQPTSMCSTPEGIGAEIGSVRVASPVFAAWCSTPEGIGAEIGARPPMPSRASRCAQRPRASERRSEVASIACTSRREMCSTPEGIGAEIGRRNGPDARDGSGVLNARGHRSGDRDGTGGWSIAIALCSTPEGIGARSVVISCVRRTPPGSCSTPEGIGAEIGSTSGVRSSRTSGAQRPRASERRSARGRASTRRAAAVLNARGHRSGDRRVARPRTSRSRSGVLNARGHRSGDRRERRCGGAWAPPCAQRPRASERRSVVAPN